MAENSDAINELVRVMEQLRAPDGCPWDRQQDHYSLKEYLREETAELLDAIDEEDDPAMIEELGDVLLQVVFHAQLAREEGRFSLDVVAKKCSEKLVRRHPHVFRESEVADVPEVLQQWEAIKRQEKRNRTSGTPSALAGVPKQLCALQRAYKMQKKAASVGFDWPAVEEVCQKIEEELNEVRQALKGGDDQFISEEIGDLLFSVANLGRFTGKNPEELLQRTVHKFEHRFSRMEELAGRDGREDLDSCTLEELNDYWEQAKRG